MIRHEDLTTPALAAPPVAPAVGPFSDAGFLRLVAGREPEVFEHDGGAAMLVIADGVARFAGEPDLTDYHTPVGEDAAGLFAAIAEELGPDLRFDLDSLPIEAAEPVAKGLEMAGRTAAMEQHQLTAVIDLPDAFDLYLAGLGKKQRHEVRRKRRRYEEHLGEVLLESHGAGGWAFDEFVRLHRLAGGEKGTFMTEEREVLFADILVCPGWRIDLLRVPGEARASACLFVYEDEEGYYLYNSSYDPEMREASPGVAIVGAGIEQAIRDGVARFDFLKGDEVYKFRLGASERPLFRVTG